MGGCCSKSWEQLRHNDSATGNAWTALAKAYEERVVTSYDRVTSLLDLLTRSKESKAKDKAAEMIACLYSKLCSESIDSSLPSSTEAVEEYIRRSRQAILQAGASAMSGSLLTSSWTVDET